MAQRNWEKFSVGGGRGGEEAGEVERGLSLQGFGLIFWNLCFILRERTEAFKAPSFEFIPLGFNLHCNYSKADTEEKNENRSLWQASG